MAPRGAWHPGCGCFLYCRRPSMLRFLRYLAPNLVTSTGMLFGMLSLVASYEHRFADAGWFIIWAVLLDRVDGFVARSLKASSDFGVQMDSFADAMNFGVAPAFMVYVSLSSVPSLGFGTGPGRWLLLVACAIWVLANVFRLAKFNVVAEPEDGPKVFFGVPTTLAAGTMVIWTLVLHKYSAQGALLGDPTRFLGPRLLTSWSTPIAAWSYLPAVMLVGAFLMASNLPQPKLQPAKQKVLTMILIVGALSGFVCGFARFMPEYMALLPTGWLLCSLVWGQLSPKARGFETPSFLPPDLPTSLEDDEGSAVAVMTEKSAH